MTYKWMSLEQYHKMRYKQLSTDFDKHWMPEDPPKYIIGSAYQIMEIDRKNDNETDRGIW